MFPNAACVVSLIDRLVHRCEIISIQGQSYRNLQGEQKNVIDRQRRRLLCLRPVRLWVTQGIPASPRHPRQHSAFIRRPEGSSHPLQGAVDGRTVNAQQSGDIRHGFALVDQLTRMGNLLRRQAGLAAKPHATALRGLDTGASALGNQRPFQLWISMGHGYDLTAMDAREAHRFALDAAQSADHSQQIESRLKQMLSEDRPMTPWLGRALGMDSTAH